MNDWATKEWLTRPLGELAELRRGITYSTDLLEDNEHGVTYVNMKSFLKGGGYNVEGTKKYSGPFTPADLLGLTDLIVANTDVTAGDIIGVPALLPVEFAGHQVLFSHHVTRLRLSSDIIVPILYYLLCLPEYRSEMMRIARGTTVLMLDMRAMRRISIRYPTEQSAQRKIARILSTVDNLIEKTEALIEKYQQMKQGMMHDLFTRGVNENGELRPPQHEAPHLYRQSELGWIPKEWEVRSLSSLAESIVDGPFGSNLKTEHYVDEAGVRVVRLQNILETEYDDSEPAFISERYAQILAKHEVCPGDVLIAALGEDNSPVGRACCYPENLPPAINKADCFRLRCRAEFALNEYVMYLLNTELTRRQFRSLEQGVTRRRTNLGNMRKVLLALPSLEKQNTEQRMAVDRLAVISTNLYCLHRTLEKLRKQKFGLMQDLLTGSVPVVVEEETTTSNHIH